MLRWTKQLVIWVVLAVVIVAVLVAALASWVGNGSTDPLEAAAQASASLVTTTTQMQKSFDSLRTSNKTAAEQYLDYLDKIQSSCHQISLNQAAATKKGLSATGLSLFSNSVTLCDDLVKVTKGSEAIYRPTLPLLTASTHAKRYQLFAPLRNHIRSDQSTEVATALKAVTATRDIPADFPTQVLPQLRQLQQSIKTSHDLAYLPALQTFQVQMLSERARYWNDYVGLSSLVSTLKVQLDGYCRALANNGQTPGFCHV